jgi:hypothetical protein
MLRQHAVAADLHRRQFGGGPWKPRRPAAELDRAGGVERERRRSQQTLRRHQLGDGQLEQRPFEAGEHLVRHALAQPRRAGSPWWRAIR